MTASLSTVNDRSRPSAIPPWLVRICLVLAVANLTLCGTAYFSQWWVYDRDGLGIPTDFVNVWAAGRLVLDGLPAQAYDWDIQKQVEVAKLGQDFVGYFAWHYPPPFLFVASLLAQLPYKLAFIGWVVGQLRAFSGRDARDRRPPLRLSARARRSDGVHQCTGRPERIPHRGADRRHALSDPGAAGAGRHLPRAFDLQAAIRAVVSDRADRGRALARVRQRRCDGDRAGHRVLARLRHRELAGVLPAGCRYSRRPS